MTREQAVFDVVFCDLILAEFGPVPGLESLRGRALECLWE